MGGGPNWDEWSTTFATKGLERGTENVNKGNGQKKDVYHAEVYPEYSSLICDALDSDAAWINQTKAETMLDRTPLAVFTRAKKVRATCLKLHGLVNIIKSAKPTGDPKESKFMNESLAIYNQNATAANMYRYLRSDETPGKEFPFMKEYEWYQETSIFPILGT